MNRFFAFFRNFLPVARSAPSRITRGAPLSGFIPGFKTGSPRISRPLIPFFGKKPQRALRPVVENIEPDTINVESLPTLDRELQVRR